MTLAIGSLMSGGKRKFYCLIIRVKQEINMENILWYYILLIETKKKLLDEQELFICPSYELFTSPVVPLLQGHSNQTSTLLS